MCCCSFPGRRSASDTAFALDNTVGVIDADYYFADNLGHIRIRMTNGGGKPLCIRRDRRSRRACSCLTG